MQHWTTDANAFADLLESAADAMLASPVRDGCVVRLPMRGSLVVSGDIHDNPLHFAAVLRLARLDGAGAAAAGAGERHLALQELIHGEASGQHPGDDRDMSHRMLGRVAELVLAHPGRVHPLLANHEIAQLRGHPIAKGGVNNVAQFDAGLEWAFGDDAFIAAEAVKRFIRAMPLAAVCENGAFVSHSLPSSGGARHFDVRVLERELHDEDFDPPYGAAYMLTWGRTHTPEHLAALARDWNVRTFIVGHTFVESGAEFRSPNMLILNSDHPRGRVLEIDLASPVSDAAALVDRALPLASMLDGLGRLPGDGARA